MLTLCRDLVGWQDCHCPLPFYRDLIGWQDCRRPVAATTAAAGRRRQLGTLGVLQAIAVVGILLGPIWPVLASTAQTEAITRDLDGLR